MPSLAVYLVLLVTRPLLLSCVTARRRRRRAASAAPAGGVVASGTLGFEPRPEAARKAEAGARE